jgi:hypothetical protein
VIKCVGCPLRSGAGSVEGGREGGEGLFGGERSQGLAME